MAKISCIETLKVPCEILSRNGLLYTDQLTEFSIVKIILNYLFDVTMLILISLNIANSIKIGNHRFANWMTCILIPMANYTAKATTLLLNKKCLLEILEDLKSETFNLHSETLNRNIQLINKVSKLMMRYFTLVLSLFLVIVSILPFVINIRLMIPAPFDTGRFDVIYKVLHFFSSSYLAVNSTCFDVLYLTLLGLATAQLNILEERLVYLQRDANTLHRELKMYNFRSLDTITINILKECVILHKKIIEFVKKLSTLLSFPLFVQYTCGCFIICNTILQLTIMGETDTTNIIGISGYSGVTFTQMAAYHWLANEIIYKSDKIIESCYLSKWYESSLSAQKYIVVLMERAKRPIIVELYSFVYISLESLGVIVRWAYSVFALIKARYR